MKKNISKNNLLIFLFLIIFIFLLFFYRNIENFKINNNLSSNLKIIHVWHGEQNNKDIKQYNTIKFMYKPLSYSTIKLLEYSNKDYIIDYKTNYYNFDEINPNEILIWIGQESFPDFNLLKSKDIYTIWFNADPYNNIQNSDEIWTYSKQIFNSYENSEKNDKNQIIKFIPIICEENVPFVPYNKATNNNIKLVFIGDFSCRSDKKDILFKSQLLKNNIEEVYDLWNDTDFNNYISKNPAIYLNLTKLGTDALPSVRINKLLSHKCIIISEHTNDIDEEYYKEMVYFCNINDIEDIYKKIINESNIEEISNKIYKKFYDKFYYKNAINLIDIK